MSLYATFQLIYQSNTFLTVTSTEIRSKMLGFLHPPIHPSRTLIKTKMTEMWHVSLSLKLYVSLLDMNIKWIMLKSIFKNPSPTGCVFMAAHFCCLPKKKGSTNVNKQHLHNSCTPVHFSRFSKCCSCASPLSDAPLQWWNLLNAAYRNSGTFSAE